MNTTQERKPTSQRRQEIVAAVMRIIGEQGLVSLTTKTIAREVGVTSGAIFRHFASLEEVLEEVVRTAIAALEETFPDPSLPPKERLFALAKARVGLLAGNRGMAWMLTSDQASLTLPESAVEDLRKIAKRSKNFLLAALKEGVVAGDFRDDIPPEVLMIPLTGTIHHLIGSSGVHRIGRKRVSADEVLKSIALLLSPPA